MEAAHTDEMAAVRLDIHQGATLALMAMLLSLIESHHDRARLLGMWKVFRERCYAAALNSDKGDGVPEAFSEVAGQLERQVLISLAGGADKAAR